MKSGGNNIDTKIDVGLLYIQLRPNYTLKRPDFFAPLWGLSLMGVQIWAFPGYKRKGFQCGQKSEIFLTPCVFKDLGQTPSGIYGVCERAPQIGGCKPGGDIRYFGGSLPSSPRPVPPHQGTKQY